MKTKTMNSLFINKVLVDDDESISK